MTPDDYTNLMSGLPRSHRPGSSMDEYKRYMDAREIRMAAKAIAEWQSKL